MLESFLLEHEKSCHHLIFDYNTAGITVKMRKVMLEIPRKYNFLSEGKGMVMIWSVGVFHPDICVVIKFYYILLCLLTKADYFPTVETTCIFP